MTLYSIDEGLQNPIGRGDYWRLFEQFYESELHKVFESEIAIILQGVGGNDKVNSKFKTKRILTKLENSNPEILEDWDKESLARLFGMTLWNVIVRQPDDWYFIRMKDEQSGEFRYTLYWRR